MREEATGGVFCVGLGGEAEIWTLEADVVDGEGLALAWDISFRRLAGLR